VELADLAGCFLADDLAVDADAARKFLTPAILPALAELADRLEGLHDWTQDQIQRAFEAVLTSHGLALGKLAQPARVALTGKTTSPGIFEVLELVGRERAIRRIRVAAGHTGTSASL
jgi:glutamyl-tRNA synthetase